MSHTRMRRIEESLCLYRSQQRDHQFAPYAHMQGHKTLEEQFDYPIEVPN